MKGKYDTFIVRIHGESDGKFRGYVQHIRSQEEVHFDNFEDMKGFMDKHLGLLNNAASQKDERFVKK